MKIALIDSGIGGLTLLKRLRTQYPKTDYLYFADTYAHPYGSLDKSYLKERLFSIAELLYERRADMIILACNTASTIALHDLKARFDIPILGVLPKCDEPKGTLIACTPLTARSKMVVEYKDRGAKIYSNPCLATLIERYISNLNRLSHYLTEELSRYSVERVVLGCTHYVYLREMVQKITGASVLDGFDDILETLKCHSPNNGGGTLDFIFTGKKESARYLDVLERAQI